MVMVPPISIAGTTPLGEFTRRSLRLGTVIWCPQCSVEAAGCGFGRTARRWFELGQSWNLWRVCAGGRGGLDRYATKELWTWELKIDVREEHSLGVHWFSPAPGVLSLMPNGGGSVEPVPRRKNFVPVIEIGVVMVVRGILLR